MMKKLLLASAFGMVAMASAAMAAPQSADDQLAQATPTQMSDSKMDQVTAGQVVGNLVGVQVTNVANNNHVLTGNNVTVPVNASVAVAALGTAASNAAQHVTTALSH